MTETSPDLVTFLLWVLVPGLILGVSWFGFVVAIATVREVKTDHVLLRTLFHKNLAVSPASLKRAVVVRDLGFVLVFLMRARNLSLYPWIVVVPSSRRGESVANQLKMLFQCA